ADRLLIERELAVRIGRQHHFRIVQGVLVRPDDRRRNALRDLVVGLDHRHALVHGAAGRRHGSHLSNSPFLRPGLSSLTAVGAGWLLARLPWSGPRGTVLWEAPEVSLRCNPWLPRTARASPDGRTRRRCPRPGPPAPSRRRPR